MERPVISLVFDDPPPPGTRRRVADQFGPVLAGLMQYPNTWARIATYPSRAGAWHVPPALKKAGFTGFEFEVRSKGSESGVWARYIGQEQAAA